MERRCYIDLDLTLYDTDRMIQGIRTDIVGLGSPAGEVDRIMDELSAEGYSFEEHLRRLGYASDVVASKADEYRALQNGGDRFLYADVAHGMDRLGRICECHLLTYGFPEYQRHKFRGIQALQPHFAATHYVWRGQTKGDLVYAERAAGRDDWVVDDSFAQLDDIRRKAPWARLLRMRRPTAAFAPHPGDGVLWQVVDRLEAVLQLMEGS